MDRTAIEKIIEVAEPHIITENGYIYSDKRLSIISEPAVSTIHLTTLDSMVELIKAEYTNFSSPLIVHIEGHAAVTLHTGIAESDRTRETPYCVSAEVPVFDFNRQINYESMMIALKSKFVETPELLNLVQLLGTIIQENNMQIADDGFTQSVTVRKGIAIKGNKAVNPIVKLKPYRTFLEVEQPESNFLVRLFDGGNVALFEADGGAWKLTARKAIADYLKTKLAELIDTGEIIVTA